MKNGPMGKRGGELLTLGLQLCRVTPLPPHPPASEGMGRLHCFRQGPLGLPGRGANGGGGRALAG